MTSPLPSYPWSTSGPYLSSSVVWWAHKTSSPQALFSLKWVEIEPYLWGLPSQNTRLHTPSVWSKESALVHIWVCRPCRQLHSCLCNLHVDEPMTAHHHSRYTLWCSLGSHLHVSPWYKKGGWQAVYVFGSQAKSLAMQQVPSGRSGMTFWHSIFTAMIKFQVRSLQSMQDKIKTSRLWRFLFSELTLVHALAI